MITLYIATHNKTGLKYFGKTTKVLEGYYGSGKYWKRHLNKHGKDISMEIWYQDENQQAITNLAIMFSETYNIVESEEWANLIDENGLDGCPLGYKHTDKSKDKIKAKRAKQIMSSGWQHTEKTKEKIRKKRKHQKFSLETRKKMSVAQSNRIYTEADCKNMSDKSPRRAVIRYDLTGNIIKCYLSLDYVKDDGFQPSNVSKCCSGEYTTSKGSIWRYKEDPLEPEGSISSLLF